MAYNKRELWLLSLVMGKDVNPKMSQREIKDELEDMIGEINGDISSAIPNDYYEVLELALISRGMSMENARRIVRGMRQVRRMAAKAGETVSSAVQTAIGNTQSALSGVNPTPGFEYIDGDLTQGHPFLDKVNVAAGWLFSPINIQRLHSQSTSGVTDSGLISYNSEQELWASPLTPSQNPYELDYTEV
jgi:hypothetical protein